jgi:hypothetical protein
MDLVPPESGLFIQPLNEMIGAFKSRDAVINRHVTEVVVFLLFATFILTGVVIDYANGAEDHRPSIAAHVLALLIVLLFFIIIFIIIDFDRARRGLVQVPQANMIYVQSTIQAAETVDSLAP